MSSADITNMINANLMFIIFGFCGFSLILFIISIVALARASKLKKRIDKFLVPSQSHNIEAMLMEYLEEVKKVGDRHDDVMKYITDINSQLAFCVQKVGIVRYNPFEDVGGDLCFAIALLNAHNDGIILNSIYSREGCYNYAKPIESGESKKYKLSGEEQDALNQALSKR